MSDQTINGKPKFDYWQARAKEEKKRADDNFKQLALRVKEVAELRGLVERQDQRITELGKERDEWERKSKNNGLAAAIGLERSEELQARLEAAEPVHREALILLRHIWAEIDHTDYERLAGDIGQFLNDHWPEWTAFDTRRA